MNNKDIEKIERYKDYPEGSVGKEVYDSTFLPFQDYLNKYHSSTNINKWEKWQKKYIEPAFDEDRNDELVKNFGYVKREFHNFDTQYRTYKLLQSDSRLDDETKRFIGFMAGVGFFERYEISVEDWFEMINWSQPDRQFDEGKPINDILRYQFGINLLKSSLPELPFWKR